MSVQVRLARVTGSVASPNTISASGFTDGDLILLQVRHSSTGVTVTVPAGFTLLYSVTGGTGNEVRVYYKIASGESGNYSVSWTGGSGVNTSRLGIVALYSDAGKTLILDGHATQDNTSSSTNLPCPSITTTINGALRVDFVGIFNAVTTTAGAGQTKQYDTGGTSTVAAFTQTIASAGATGTRTPTGGTAQISRVVTVAYAEMPAPTAPSGLSAEAITASRIDLSWTDNASTEDGFSLERSADGLSGWSEIATPAADATSYSDTGLSQNTGYYYRIRAHNGGGYSSYSDIAYALTLLSLPPVSHPRLFLLNPAVVFAARVNLPDPAVYPISFVAFDTVTTGDYTDIEDGQLLLLGTSAGGDDLGRQRVRGTPTAIKIYVGRSSQGTRDGELTLQDNAYITVVDLRMLWAKIPFIDSDGNIFKDSDLEVGDRTTEPPPVSNSGEGYAATINADGVIIVSLPGQDSFATADGATITDYLWDIGDGTLLVGSSLTDTNIDVSFPAGFRYVSLTVTDSNGKSHTSYVPILADDPNDRLSLDGFAVDNRRVTDAGQTLTVKALEDMPRATYPDGTLAMIWDREPLGAANRDHMLIVGWLDAEEYTIHAQKTGILRDTSLTILDAGAKLDALPGFPQSVADDDTRDTDELPDMTWNYGVNITLDWYIHYLLYWHSTALEVVNFIWSGTGSTYRVLIKSSDGESLWQQVKRIADDMLPGYVLTTDQAGGIAVVPDPQYQEIDDRTDTVQVNITEDDYSDIRINYQRAPSIHWLLTGAVLVQTSVAYNTDGSLYLPTVFSRAPGDAPGQGVGEVEDNEALVSSQDILNQSTGHRYARQNAAIKSIVLTLIQDDSAPHSAVPWREIEPALKQWVTLTLSSQYAAQRGLSFTNLRCLPKEVNTRYTITKTGTYRTVELTLEPETSGPPGATRIMTDIPAVGEEPEVIPDPIPPPDSGLVSGADMVAAIGKFKVYRTSDFTTPSGSGGPTWDAKDLTGADEMLTWVVDPFSPGYIEGSGTIDGWAASATKLYRLADLFGTTPTATAVVTFANTASWRTIQASFGTYYPAGQNPWLICVSYYGSTGGHTGTWATYSIDGGTTWATEVQVSAFYDSGGAINPIGLYCSPKTPGLAYTAAHLATANPATSGGFVSTDWGATWTAMPTADDPATPLPLFGDFSDTVSSSTVTHTYVEDGPLASASHTNSHSGTVNEDWSDYLCIAPPANAKRVTVQGTFTGFRSGGGFGNSGYSFNINHSGASVLRTVVSDSDNGLTGKNQTYIRNFTYQYDFGDYLTQDWPHNRTLVEAIGTPATSDYAIRYNVGVAAAGVTGSWTATATLALRVSEIILDDGTVYTPQDAGIISPVHGQAGELHLPWPDNDAENIFYYGALDRSGNRQFALKRAVAGTATDISPRASSVDYGVNAGHFAVRTYDNDRSFVLAAVSGNDTDTNSAHDKQGVFVSSDEGDTWTQIVAPSTGTEVYQAAFGGDSEQIVYVWGPAGYFGYSSNMGTSIDSRAGNLGALSATKLIGIAGGSTG
jgi:hypothetical protein